MREQITIDHEGLRQLLGDAARRPLFEGFEIPATGPFVSLAIEVLDDFERTSGLVVRPAEPEGRVVGRFGLGFAFDPTPLLVAVFNWLLTKIGDWILSRLRPSAPSVQGGPQPLTKPELEEIRQLVLGFGEKLNDKAMFSRENTRKMADSIVNVLSRHPEALVQRREARTHKE